MDVKNESIYVKNTATVEVDAIVEYAIAKGFITEADKAWAVNASLNK